eukprot:TRINITY_DN2949_c0_g1_i1.p1 TRINITY_DN2949_c0_g1~~TRINITY_DN2949_c0_g1_i1.p1  ORF type:complete len:805 (+),score=231.12 TRINITY_DN2949_c0_g1_i1:290-2416(+)
MGIPNVYLGHVYGQKSVKIVAAKSLYREETKVVETQGRVQSGIIFVGLDLTAEEITMMRERAYQREGLSSITCLNESMNILSSAGFGEKSGINVLEMILPHNFLYAMLTGSIKPVLNGREFKYAIVKTTPKSLEEYYNAIRTATVFTPFRHLGRFLDSEVAREERKRIARRITQENEAKFHQLHLNKPEENPQNVYAVEVSETSSLGAFFRKIWGTHVIAKIQVGANPKFSPFLEENLPQCLKEFDRPSLDFFTKVKKNLLFSQSVVDLIRSHLTQNFDRYDNFTQQNLVNLLVPEVDGNEMKYNFVVTSRELIIISNSVRIGFVDWILSKHVLISGYSHDVRFAGEVWMDEEHSLHINANSGTYRPTEEQLDRVVELASLLFPDLKFCAEHAKHEEDVEKKEEEDVDMQEDVELEEDDFEWVPMDSHEHNEENELEQTRNQLSLITKPLTTKPRRKEENIGVLLAKFDPLTTHHEETIESALKAGVFDKIIVVPSDITTDVIRTPVLDRQNMINLRYSEDPRVITFLAHSLPGVPLWGWVSNIVHVAREAHYSPVSVFLMEDYIDPTKRARLVKMVDGDSYLVIYGKDDDPSTIPSVDPTTGKPIVAQLGNKPPKSEEVRDYLASHGELYYDHLLLKDDTLPLSPKVKNYIYNNSLYHGSKIAGNITDSFRNVFGTGLGNVLGRTAPVDTAVNDRVLKKLNENRLYY